MGSGKVTPLITPRSGVPVVANWHRNSDVADDAIMRLFVFPHAGGRPREYKPFASALASHRVEVCTLDFTTTDMIDMLHFTNAILDLILYPTSGGSLVDKPFAFFGHSAGAIMAFAIALELENRSLPRPTRVFVSAHAAPHVMERLPTEWDTNDEVMRELLRAWGGTDEAILNDPVAIGAFLPGIKAQLNVVDSYLLDQHLSAPRMRRSIVSTDSADNVFRKIGVPLHVCTGISDNTMTEAEANAWEALTVDAIVMQAFMGDHFYHLNAGFDALLLHIAQALDEDTQRHADESAHSLAVWNSGTMKWPENDLLHEWFRQQAKVYSDRVAVVCQTTNRSYTYKEVDDLSERLAFYLRNECGVGVDDITAIFMEHCAEFVIAYIAALKAGGAYMPLELVYPPDLLARVLESAKPKCVLTKKIYENRLPTWQKQYSTDSLAMLPPCDLVECHPRPTPDSLAYVVMSSGTTGLPKGIMCPHKGAVHSYNWRLQTYPFEEGDRVACHVFFVWELLRPMLGGASLFVIPDDIIFDAEALTIYLEKNAITRILVTPSLLQLILDSVCAKVLTQRLATLKILWLCGEVVTIELRNRFLELALPTKLLNLYSISECHDVSASDLTILTDPWENPKYSSCGKLIPNVRAYILDEQLKTVPVGAPGELYVSGPVLARGYLHMEEKTKERFVDNPFIQDALMYRTGDRGRFLPSGALELMGRCDFMVKIRGYSVVLGAIEAALGELENISAAVVIAEGEEGSDKKLIAYIVPENWKLVPRESDVRLQLKMKLPHYAVPSIFVLINALPIHSASGKTDRKNLPPVDGAQRLEAGTILEESTFSPTELALRAIWADMLDLELSSIGRQDSFFEIGGHSLMATKLLGRIQHLNKIASDITLKQLLQNATLEGLASVIDSGESGEELRLSDEAVLEESIFPAATRKTGYARLRVAMSVMRPRKIFLTGATGFLGAHILHKLLQDSGVRCVFCLVRAPCNVEGLTKDEAEAEKIEAGFKRLLQQFVDQKLEIDEDEFRQRVYPVSGSLSKPLLGLSAEDFRDLASEIDAVIHSAAEVNLVKPYEALKQSNVLGTQEVLRLCVTNSRFATNVKPMHFISTNAVFPPDMPIQPENFDVTSLSEEIAKKGDGYAQTKWVAEQLVLHARSRGLPCCIYRPGCMAPSFGGKAIWNPNDFYYTTLKGCAKLGSAPTASWRYDLTPVDFAASAIAHLSTKAPHRSMGQIFHLQSPYEPLSQSAVVNASSWKSVEEADWKARVTTDTSLASLQVALDAFEQYFKSPAHFQCEQLVSALEGSGIQCPECDPAYISRILTALSD